MTTTSRSIEMLGKALDAVDAALAKPVPDKVADRMIADANSIDIEREMDAMRPKLGSINLMLLSRIVGIEGDDVQVRVRRCGFDIADLGCLRQTIDDVAEVLRGKYPVMEAICYEIEQMELDNIPEDVRRAECKVPPLSVDDE